MKIWKLDRVEINISRQKIKKGNREQSVKKERKKITEEIGKITKEKLHIKIKKGKGTIKREETKITHKYKEKRQKKVS